MVVLYLQENKVKRQNMFIEEYKISKKICAGAIDFFNQNKKYHKQGLVGDGRVDKKVKDSTDLLCFDVEDNPRITDYFNELDKCISKYKQKYIYCDKEQCKWSIRESPIVQRYKPGGGYKTWHYERNGHPLHVRRHLVFMTYLNTIRDGGGTEFFYQKKKFKASQGSTLIWPADWTFAHKGIVSKKYEKYIITGWISYI